MVELLSSGKVKFLEQDSPLGTSTSKTRMIKNKKKYIQLLKWKFDYNFASSAMFRPWVNHYSEI